MSDAFTFGLVCLVLALLIAVFIAYRNPTLFEAFVGSIQSIEIGLTGIKIKRAATAVAAAQKAKQPGRPIQVPTKLLRLLAEPPHVLWVDDHPENNRNEQSMLASLGISIDIAISNVDALEKARKAVPDLVISDIDREQEGAGAGLLLPEILGTAGMKADVVYYVGQTTAPTTAFGAPVVDAPLDLLKAVAERFAPCVRQESVRTVVL